MSGLYLDLLPPTIISRVFLWRRPPCRTGQCRGRGAGLVARAMATVHATEVVARTAKMEAATAPGWHPGRAPEGGGVQGAGAPEKVCQCGRRDQEKLLAAVAMGRRSCKKWCWRGEEEQSRMEMECVEPSGIRARTDLPWRRAGGLVDQCCGAPRRGEIPGSEVLLGSQTPLKGTWRQSTTCPSRGMLVIKSLEKVTDREKKPLGAEN